MAGPDICLLDNLSTQRYCSLFDLPDNATYRFIEADALTADLVSLCRGTDVVIHLAAVFDAADGSVPATTIDRVNRGGTERIARACAQAGCPLIFVSTTSVYGTHSGPVDEDCRIDDVRSLGPYTESKWNAELLLETFGRETGTRDTAQSACGTRGVAGLLGSGGSGGRPAGRCRAGSIRIQPPDARQRPAVLHARSACVDSGTRDGQGRELDA